MLYSFGKAPWFKRDISVKEFAPLDAHKINKPPVIMRPWFNIRSSFSCDNYFIIIVLFYNFQDTGIIYSWKYQNNQVYIILIILLLYIQINDRDIVNQVLYCY